MTNLWPFDAVDVDGRIDDPRLFRQAIDEPETGALPAPDRWEPWVRGLFPKAVKRPFAPHHRTFWEHVWSIQPGVAPRPFIGIWAREGGKSTNIELAATALATRGIRPYGVYVRRTQDKADDSVQNVARKLESAMVAAHYPEHSRAYVNKFGTRTAWRRNRLSTAGGFTLDAIGLDAAVRGAKIDDDRPGFIIFDDLDDELDSAGETQKKLTVITTAILPAGSEDCAVFGVQNLIIPDGIFSRLADSRADFLADRIVSGPHPAIYGLKWELRDDATTGLKLPTITEGTASWEGQSVAKCQALMRRWGPRAFEREAQHKVKERAEGLALDFDPAEHYEDKTPAEIRGLLRSGRPFAGADHGAWRFGWVLLVADEYGVVRRVAEVFSQREASSVRAQRIHDECVKLGLIIDMRLVKPLPMWGDSASPQEITDLNAAWKALGSPLRLLSVGKEGKQRRASVDRVNEQLGLRALRFVRMVGAADRWLLGYNASNPGVTMTGSRLMWEVDHWSYATPQPGKVDLLQSPDDHTADGADLVSALRYALLSWWRPARAEDEEDLDAWSPEVLAAESERTWKRKRKQKRKALIQELDDGM